MHSQSGMYASVFQARPIYRHACVGCGTNRARKTSSAHGRSRSVMAMWGSTLGGAADVALGAVGD